MLRILHNTSYNFIKPWRIAIGLTIAFIVLGFGAMAWHGGVNYSIEFTGGTLMQLAFRQPPDVGRLRSALDAGGIRGAEIQQYGSPRDFTVRAQEHRPAAAQGAGAETVSREIQSVLDRTYGPGDYRVVRTEAVGPRVGSDLRRGALYAILAS